MSARASKILRASADMVIQILVRRVGFASSIVLLQRLNRVDFFKSPYGIGAHKLAYLVRAKAVDVRYPHCNKPCIAAWLMSAYSVNVSIDIGQIHGDPLS